MRRRSRASTDIFTHHARAIAKQSLRMPEAMLGVMGGPSKAEAQHYLCEDSVWESMTPLGQQSSQRWYGKKYGLTSREVESMLSVVTEDEWDEITRALEEWRDRAGLPANDSPLTRGMLMDLASGRLSLDELHRELRR